MKRLSQDEIEREIAALEAMDSKPLRQRWRDVHGTEPPPKIKSGLLRLAVAYGIQEKALGGLRPTARRQMQAHVMALDRGLAEGAASRHKTVGRLTPGTQLMREWNGAMLLVEVVDGGFRWKDTTYRTLSAVAVAITGTKWSGPKFFGLLSTAAKAGPSPKASPS